MGQKEFNQHRVREIVAALRAHSRGNLNLSKRTTGDAANLIEDMIQVVYGIQERFPIEQEVEIKEGKYL